MITADDIRRVSCELADFDLHGPEKVDDSFIERARIAHTWVTTRRGRWRLFTRVTCYGIRHSAEYDTQSFITDKCFAVGAALAGWELARDRINPAVLRFRRAKV